MWSMTVGPRGRRAVWSVVIVLGVMVIFGWGRTRTRLMLTHTLEVEWSGCAAELRGPVCEIDPDTLLTLWVPLVPCREIELRAGFRRLPFEGSSVQRGTRVRVQVSPEDRYLVVWACGVSWSLPLSPRVMPPILDELNRLRLQSPQEALQKLQMITQELPASFVGVAVGIEARILAATDGIGKAEPVFARAIELLDRAGRVSDACSARRALSFFRTQNLQLDKAQAILEASRACVDQSPTSRALWPYYEALAALEEPNIRRALERIERSIRAQERLGRSELRWSLRLRARVLAILGRFEEAAMILQSELEDADRCGRARFGNELGWTALQAMEAGQPILTPKAVQAVLENSARDALGCGEAQLRPTVLLNLAFAHVQQGQADRAFDALVQAREDWVGDVARADPWFTELEGHIDRLRGETGAALAAFRSLDALGARRIDEHTRWRAAIGLGQTFEEAGRWDAAIDAYRAAEDSIDRQLRLVPFGEGRASFVEARSPGTTRLLSLLLKLGRVDEAATLARVSLRRGLRNLARASRLASLDVEGRLRWKTLMSQYRQKRRDLSGMTNEAWRLTDSDRTLLRQQAVEIEQELQRTLDLHLQTEGREDRPRPPEEGELLLVFHPLDEGRWAGFAVEPGRVQVERLGAIDQLTSSEAQAQEILTPFAAALRRARVVLVLAPGVLSGIDFHALSFDGRPLLDRKPVFYTLDLGASLGSVPPPTRALVTRDRSGSLMGVEGEAAAVMASMPGSKSWDGRRLEALFHELENAEHFHHAGHGRSAGWDGLESVLVIGDDLRLSSGDILMLRRVPRTAVLAGCDLARTATLSATLALGVGQAFVVRGAARVVAPVRAVMDTETAAFSALLYGRLRNASSFSEAVFSAQLRLHDERPSADWSAFRVWVP